jgi:hypothetical protein
MRTSHRQAVRTSRASASLSLLRLRDSGWLRAGRRCPLRVVDWLCEWSSTSWIPHIARRARTCPSCQALAGLSTDFRADGEDPRCIPPAQASAPRLGARVCRSHRIHPTEARCATCRLNLASYFRYLCVLFPCFFFWCGHRRRAGTHVS